MHAKQLPQRDAPGEDVGHPQPPTPMSGTRPAGGSRHWSGGRGVIESFTAQGVTSVEGGGVCCHLKGISACCLREERDELGKYKNLNL